MLVYREMSKLIRAIFKSLQNKCFDKPLVNWNESANENNGFAKSILISSTFCPHYLEAENFRS